MRTLIVLPHSGWPEGLQAPLDLRHQLRDIHDSDAGLILGVYLGGLNPSADLRQPVLVPWTDVAARVLWSVQAGHAGGWQVELRAVPEPTTTAASAAWAKFRHALAHDQGDRLLLTDPLQRLAEGRKAALAEKAVIAPPPSDLTPPEMSPATREALRLREWPDDIRRRLGLTDPNFATWIQTHAEGISSALLHDGTPIPPRVAQAWASRLPVGALDSPAGGRSAAAARGFEASAGAVSPPGRGTASRALTSISELGRMIRGEAPPPPASPPPDTEQDDTDPDASA